MLAPTVSELSLYPVKSCSGHQVETFALDRFGPAGDRRWMITDPDGRFLTQREYPRLALVRVAVQAGGGLHLTNGSSTCEVALPATGAVSRRVDVWGDQVQALDAGDAAAAWLSRHLDTPCRLVYMPQDSKRPVDPAFADAGQTVSFADAFPLLLISRASLDDLNSRLPQPVPMNRFRPNLVVGGCEPFAEDSWRRIRVGSVEFDVVKACQRCSIPSIDQATAERDGSINRVLASYRRFDRKILFGQNLLYSGGGRIAVGDPVTILQ
ncbi:MOSC domain-containing protein [Kineobactrum salinum]|uniref:MOSC domain-containing protein n=1 Tax=Kineobactrum salinum TaxID=2708301 RepID=A0A6C0U1J1_9GAMM|nr:MOSC N-terminal beta barrel domain-containing protein [Kineobactrum salinum]QIB64847.1 MOSC domain-containing protein [Kineobactrum salinum]